MDIDRLKGAAREVGGKVQSAIGKASGDAGMQAEGSVREAIGQGQGLYSETKDRAGRAIDDAAHVARDAYEHGEDYAQRGARAVEKTVQTYPLAYLALAGALGFLASLLLNERRR